MAILGLPAKQLEVTPMAGPRIVLAKFVKDDQGIAITEYGLLIALVVVLLIAVVSVFSSSIASWFTNKTNKITSF